MGECSMMTFKEIEKGMLLRLEKTHKYEPSYVVKVVDKDIRIINGVEAQFIVIEDPEHPNHFISKPPCLFQPYFDEDEEKKLH
jgi:hypothetical protein